MSSHLTCLGWTLIHFLWQAAIIALIYKAIDVICSRMHSQVRYLLALVALLSTFAAASVTLLYEETSVQMAAGSAPLSARTPVLFLQTVLTHAAMDRCAVDARGSSPCDSDSRRLVVGSTFANHSDNAGS